MEQIIISAISKVGFPIVICLIVLFKFDKRFETLINVFDKKMTNLHTEVKDVYQGAQGLNASVLNDVDKVSSKLNLVIENQSFIMGRLDIHKPAEKKVEFIEKRKGLKYHVN